MKHELTPETLVYVREHMASHVADGTSCSLATHMVVRLCDALEANACPDCGVVGGHRSLRLVPEDTST